MSPTTSRSDIIAILRGAGLLAAFFITQYVLMALVFGTAAPNTPVEPMDPVCAASGASMIDDRCDSRF